MPQSGDTFRTHPDHTNISAALLRAAGERPPPMCPTIRRRVMVAEDSPTRAAVLQAHLEDAGFEVLVAGDGAEALELIDVEPVDLLVSDVVLPDGYELCREVKGRHPEVSVVLLTSMSDPLDVVRALSAGADNFMRKPYEPIELIHRINNTLDNKRLREARPTPIGMELLFLGGRHRIDADREQILDLLVSTFEDLVAVDRRLSAREEDLAAARDELALRLAESEQEQERLNAVLGAMPAGMAVVDLDARVVHANANLADMVGVPLSQLDGSVVWDAVRFVDPHGTPIASETRALHESLRAGHGAVRGGAFELFLDRSDGVRFPVVARTEPVFAADGEVIGAVGTLEDLRLVVDHDPVTGLPGEGILLDRLQTAADLGAQRGTETGLLVVVVDRLQRFRDSLSGAEVDRLLATVAAHLQRALHADEVIVRAPAASAAYLGNGEFAVVMPDVEAGDGALVGQYVVDHVVALFEAGDIRLPISVSVAVAMGSEAPDAPTLVAAAAGSAREASRAGGGRVAASDVDRHAEVIDLLRREAELRAALEHGQLVVHYQPQVSVRDERPTAVEAFVRWEHPERGLLGADEIIPLAIDSGLIAPLGWLVLEAACRQGSAWHRSFPNGRPPAVSVNLAAEQLADAGVVDRIAAILESTGFPPTALVLEITEGTLTQDPVAARARLTQVKALGCRVAIDDFGTGYSSLLQLRRLPVDILKIDRSFVAGMLQEPADAAIVAMVVRLARALGLEVVAEGVEDADQLVQLRLHGCDMAQGFRWSKALPADELARWWEANALGVMADDDPESPLGGGLDTDREHDEVVSYLVHELRTPLTAVQGFAELLQEAVPEAVAGLVEPIVRNAQELDRRLGSLSEVNDLLRGGLTLRSQDHDITQLVGDLVSDTEVQLEPHPVAFSSTGPVVAAVDRTRFLQAVSNLVSNAAKFSPDHAPIEVSVAAMDGVVAVEVRDHGPGIPEERRPELFRRFSRLGSMATGLGLGLFLARLVVEGHGGVIGYRDAPGGGAVFSIRIPRRPTPHHQPLEAAADTSRAEPGASDGAVGSVGEGRPQILCVEDDRATASLIQRVLDGCDVRIASDGRQALTLAAEAPVDLVVLDRHLGDVALDDLLDRLRALPSMAQARVAVLTAAPGDDIAVGRAGVDVVLSKPFRPEHLRRAVDSLLAGPALRSPDLVSSAAPTPGPLDESLLDALEEVAGEGDGGIDDLVQIALEDAERHRAALGRAFAAADEREMVTRAHALRGVLGSFAAHEVGRRCGDLERAVEVGDREALAKALDELERACADAERALRARFPLA